MPLNVNVMMVIITINLFVFNSLEILVYIQYSQKILLLLYKSQHGMKIHLLEEEEYHLTLIF